MEFKHIVPYLQYKPSVIVEGKDIRKATGIYLIHGMYFVQTEPKVRDFTSHFEIIRCKLALRPLSDLRNEIEVNGKKFVPAIQLNWSNITADVFSKSDYLLDRFDNLFAYDFVKLLEWHFDVFGLIEQGLAVDYNSLQK